MTKLDKDTKNLRFFEVYTYQKKMMNLKFLLKTEYTETLELSS